MKQQLATVININLKQTATPLKDGRLEHFKNMPSDGLFKHLSITEIVEHSDFILNHLHELSINDVSHFINQGVLDCKKASEKMNLRFEA